jgi:hypothetical protein
MADFDSEFKSWAENVDFRPRTVFVPKNAAELAGLIKQANTDNRRVRVLGSGWSFSDVAISHDYLVSMSSLSRVLAFCWRDKRWGHARQTAVYPSTPTKSHPPDSPVLIAALKPQLLRQSRRFAHVLGGMLLKELYLALDSPQWDTDENNQLINTRDRWALPTMGGSAGQAIAGVVSTSTHGGDFDLPPIQEMVRAIDILAPDGTRHWYEQWGSNAITDPKKLAAAYANDPVPLAQIHYDDDEFFSVLVSMGCVGIIHSLVIEVDPQFGLSQRVGLSTWNTIRSSLTNNGAFFTSMPPWINVPGMAIHPTAIIKSRKPVQVISASPVQHALEVFINPYRMSDDYFNDPMPDRLCVVVSRAKSVKVLQDPTPPEEPCGLLQAIGKIALSGAVVAFESGGPGTAKNIVNGVMQSTRTDTKLAYPVGWSVTDTYGAPLPVMSLEIALPTLGDKHLNLIDDMLDRFDKLIQKQDGSKLAGAFSLRFTKQSKAFLAIQNFGGSVEQRGARICHIEVFCVQEVKFGLNGPEKNFGEDARGLKNLNDLEDNGESFMREFENLAVKYGAHLHWGQLSLTNSHFPNKYTRYADWQKVRDQLTQNDAFRAFDNDFTVRYRISRGADHWNPLSDSLLPGSPTVAAADANASRLFPPSAFRNKEGCIEVLVIGTDGHVCWNRQTAPNTAFLGWNFVELPRTGKDLGRNFGGRVAIGVNRDNAHPEIFARNLTDKKIYHAWRSEVKDKKWGDWTEMDGNHKFESSPDVLMAGDRNLLVVARRADDRILYRDQKVELGVVGWNSWKQLPAAPKKTTFAGDPCIGQNLDQRLEVFTRDTKGFVWRSRQAQAKSDAAWADWAKLGQSAVGGDPAVGRRFDGRLEVFARGANGLLHIRQNVPNDGYEADWSIVAAFDQPLDPSGRPSVILSRKNLQVAVLTSLRNVVHFDQNNDNWLINDLGAKLASYPALAENDDTRVEIFSKFDNDFVEHRWQDASFAWIL